jgi:hypothetical protein
MSERKPEARAASASPQGAQRGEAERSGRPQDWRAKGGRAAALAALAGALFACAGVDVSEDYEPGTDFSGYRSFDWFPGGRAASGDPEVDSPFLDRRVRDALVRELGSRGFIKVEDRTPDFFVNYHISVRQKLSSSGIGIGYGVGSWGSHGGVGVGVSTPSVRTYDEGTLVIDVLDAESKRLVWRGTGSQAVKSSPKPEETTAAVDRAVAAIVAQFPPGSPD